MDAAHARAAFEAERASYLTALTSLQTQLDACKQRSATREASLLSQLTQRAACAATGAAQTPSPGVTSRRPSPDSGGRSSVEEENRLLRVRLRAALAQTRSPSSTRGEAISGAASGSSPQRMRVSGGGGGGGGSALR